MADVSAANPENMDTPAVKALVEEVLREQLRTAVADQIAAFVQQNEQRAREFSLLERMVRVEEELKALREVQTTQFAAGEKRFDALQREIAARSEALDQRFEALQREMHARFEAMDQRFQASEKRFEALQREMHARFEAMDRRFTQVQWVMGLGFSLTIAFLGLLKFV